MDFVAKQLGVDVPKFLMNNAGHIAGLAAKGTTEIEDILHIDRGYEDVVQKLRGVGADIKRVCCPDANTLTSAG